VGGGSARLLLVRYGRDQLAPRRVCIFYILLEAVSAQLAAGPGARAGPRTVCPDIRRPRSAQVPELFVVVPSQQLRYRHQHEHADPQQWRDVGADGCQRIAAVAVWQFGVCRGGDGG